MFAGFSIPVAEQSIIDPDLGCKSSRARNCRRRRQRVMERSARHEQRRPLGLIVGRLRKWCQQSRANLEWVAKQLEVDQFAVSRCVSSQECPCEESLGVAGSGLVLSEQQKSR